jgi:cytochrome P450
MNVMNEKKKIFNPLTRAFRNNPYPQYEALRQSVPEFSMGMWIVTRYADVMAILRDDRFSSASVPEITEKKMAEFSLTFPEVTELGRKAIVFTENPDHQRLRRLANSVFNNDNVNAVVKPMIARAVDELCGQIANSQSSVDIIACLADPLPYKTMLAWMGLPQEDKTRVQRWTNDVRYFLEPSVLSKQRLQESYSGLLEFRAFFKKEIEKRRAVPTNDFIGGLMAAKVDGNDVLTEDEVIYACIFGFVAGTETTKALLGDATYLLALNPDQLQLIHEGRVSIPNAANELARLASPLQMTRRRCLQDLSIAGVQIAKDEDVLLCLGGANHDPSVFPEPEKLLLDRNNSEKHIAFGFGLHVCLGAHLARLQLQAYLREIASRRMTFFYDRDPEWIEHSFMLRGLKHLDVTVSVGGEVSVGAGTA